MNDLLKPCPFCGGRAKVAITNSQYIVSCDNFRCIASEIKSVHIVYESAIARTADEWEKWAQEEVQC